MSIHTTTPPDDDRLAALIGEAFEALPAPDRWKLKDIEARLSRALTRKPQARKPSMWAWWLAGALIMGSAAAWWVYETVRDEVETEQVMPVIDDELPRKQRTVKERKDQGEISGGEAAPDTQQEKRPTQGKGPVIFRRETH